MLAQASALRIPLADQSVHSVVTSPPYWGLRDYGTAGQLGLEAVPDCLGWATGESCGTCYVCHMRQVFAEVWRVLRDDGTLWLNLGDSYAQDSKWGGQSGGKNYTSAAGGLARSRRTSGLKDKDLVGIPWRVALALQADGWYLRMDNVWAKPNPMPESVTDRPTKAHEYVFLLAKSARYYYDAEAVRETSIKGAAGSTFTEGKTGTNGQGRVSERPRVDRAATFRRATKEVLAPGQLATQHRGERDDTYSTGTRNRRSVWTVATEPYPAAHYAVFPTALVEPCVLAGTSARGVCAVCGAPWVREVERSREFESGSGRAGHLPAGKNGHGLQGGGETLDVRRGPVVRATTTGWAPACDCAAGEPVPAVVLDPFCGSGTTGLVARRHGRRFIGLDISLAYLRDHALARADGLTPPAALSTLPLFAAPPAAAGARDARERDVRDGGGE